MLLIFLTPDQSGKTNKRRACVSGKDPAAFCVKIGTIPRSGSEERFSYPSFNKVYNKQHIALFRIIKKEKLLYPKVAQMSKFGKNPVQFMNILKLVHLKTSS